VLGEEGHTDERLRKPKKEPRLANSLDVEDDAILEGVLARSKNGLVPTNLQMPLDATLTLMGPKATWVARSHELTEEKVGERKNTKNPTKNTANAHNTTRYNYGFVPVARTTIPIESLERKTRGRIPGRKIGIRLVESHK
jgi:hypothetical protein